MPSDTRPSLTAIKVARILVFLGRHERYAALLPAGAAAATERLLRATGGLKPWMLRFYAGRRRAAWLERIGERLSPGQMVRIGLRKRFMDDEIRAALAAGATQVLVIGAGFDTACMRIAAEFDDPGIPRAPSDNGTGRPRRASACGSKPIAALFVEIDHPATHASKRAGVEAVGAARANLKLIGADLAKTTLAACLAQVSDPPWDPEARTIVVAEGLLMYLEPGDVARLFEAAHELTGTGSRVAFTYMKCDARGRPDAGRASAILRGSLALIGETMRWCVSDEQALTQLLARLGWRYEPAPDRFDLGARYLAPAGLDDRDRAKPIEHMAVVSRSA